MGESAWACCYQAGLRCGRHQLAAPSSLRGPLKHQHTAARTAVLLVLLLLLGGRRCLARCRLAGVALGQRGGLQEAPSHELVDAHVLQRLARRALLLLVIIAGLGARGAARGCGRGAQAVAAGA